MLSFGLFSSVDRSSGSVAVISSDFSIRFPNFFSSNNILSSWSLPTTVNFYGGGSAWLHFPLRAVSRVAAHFAATAHEDGQLRHAPRLQPLSHFRRAPKYAASVRSAAERVDGIITGSAARQVDGTWISHGSHCRRNRTFGLTGFSFGKYFPSEKFHIQINSYSLPRQCLPYTFNKIWPPLRMTLRCW